MSHSGLQAILAGIQAPNSTLSAAAVEKLNASGEDMKLAAWTALELDTLENRQARAESMLETRTWLRFMSASFGAILVMCGAIFILTRVTMDMLDVKAEAEAWKIAFATNSPGLVMVFVGAFLMTMPLSSGQEISVRDGWAYLPPYPAGTPLVQSDADKEQHAKACEYARSVKDQNLIEANC